MATISSTTGTLNAPGSGSGLDVNGIVTKLMGVESLPLTKLATTEASYQAKISAYGSLKGALAALQSSLSSLLDAKSLRGASASIADSTIASVSTGSGAAPGSYSIQVDQLAQAQKIASDGFAAVTDAIGTGTLTFDFGTTVGSKFTSSGTGAKSVTIAAGQNTLTGIRDAVNAAAIGVTATIVNDGGTSGNRLVFTSNTSGAAGSLKVTVADDDTTHLDASGLSQLAYDPAGTAGNGRNLSQKVEALDALLVVDGISMSKASNTVTDAIQGVTLSLTKKSAGVPTTLTVTGNSSGITSGVQAFVKAYNDLASSISSLTKYDATAKKASILTGDSAARLIQTQMRSLLGTTAGPADGAYTTLSQIGVSFKVDGTLSLDSSKLSAAVGSNPTGVAALFAAVSNASDSLVTSNVVGTQTKTGTYAVNVTTLATQGKAIGAGLAGLTIEAGVNDSLTATVNGTVATVTLAAGTYASATALATEVQTKVNGALSASGLSVAATQNGGILTLISATWGSASTVDLGGTAVTAASGPFGGSASSTAGVDVAGTIGAMTATGSGQTLIGASGSDADGLYLLVNGGSTGERGSVTYSQGFAARLNTVLASLLGNDGAVAASTDGVKKQITDIGHRREQLNQRLAKIEATYRAQFSALDSLLTSMNATSTALTQQLAALPNFNSKNQ